MYERMVELAEKYQVSVVETGIIDSWDSVESKRHSYLQEGCYKAEIFKKQIEPYILYRGSFFSTVFHHIYVLKYFCVNR